MSGNLADRPDATSVGEWLDGHTARMVEEQRARIDTLNLLVTFALAVASTLVATALQVTGNALLDLTATVLLGCGLVATVVTLLFDRRRTVNLEYVSRYHRRHGASDSVIVERLRFLDGQLYRLNRAVLGYVRRAARIQLALAGAASVVAVLSLTT